MLTWCADVAGRREETTQIQRWDKRFVRTRKWKEMKRTEREIKVKSLMDKLKDFFSKELRNDR